MRIWQKYDKVDMRNLKYDFLWLKKVSYTFYPSQICINVVVYFAINYRTVKFRVLLITLFHYEEQLFKQLIEF